MRGAPASQTGLGSAEAPEPHSGLRPSGAIPRAVRRTLRPFGTSPRDGEPFHIVNTMRFNPAAERFEMLVWNDEKRPQWRAVTFDQEPAYWLREVPLPYEIPMRKWFGYTVTYAFRPLTFRERVMRYLSRLLAKVRP